MGADTDASAGLTLRPLRDTVFDSWQRLHSAPYCLYCCGELSSHPRTR